jgi:hypothetical protein
VPVFKNTELRAFDYYLASNDDEMAVSLKAKLGYKATSKLWNHLHNDPDHRLNELAFSVEAKVPRHRIKKVLIEAEDGYAQLAVSFSQHRSPFLTRGVADPTIYHSGGKKEEQNLCSTAQYAMLSTKTKKSAGWSLPVFQLSKSRRP